MLTVGGSTPYNAIYGRVPNILPSIDHITPPGEDDAPNRSTLAHTATPRSQHSGKSGRLGKSQAWASPQHEDDHASTEAKPPGRRGGGFLSLSWTEGYARLVGPSRSRGRVVCHPRGGHPLMAEPHRCGPNPACEETCAFLLAAKLRTTGSTCSQQSRETCGRASGWLWNH